MALTKVVTDGIAAGAVTATQIATNAVTVDDISDGSISTAKLADDSVTGDKLANTAVTAGTYGSSSAIPAITVDAQGRITSASTNSVTQVGGANGVDFNDSVKARFGTGNDLEIFHDGNHSVIQDVGTGNLYIDANELYLRRNATSDVLLQTNTDGSIHLKHAGSVKLATTSGGINVTGTVTCDGLTSDGDVLVLSDTGILTVRDSDDSGNATTNFIQGQNLNGANRWRIGQVSTGNEALYVTNYADQNIIFATNGTNRVHIQNDGHLRPNLNNTYDLGTSSLRWRNVYTNDLNLSNEGGTNDVDGTWGSWTIQEGEDDLFLLNRRNGKKYKFNLSEVN